MNPFEQELRNRLAPPVHLAEAQATISKSVGGALDHPAFERLDLGQHFDEYAAVLFLDIRGFTRLAMALPVAKTARIVNAVVGAASARLREYGAHINEFTGDGIMAVFSEHDHGRSKDALHAQTVFGVSHLMGEMSAGLREGLLLEDITEPVSVSIGLYSGDVRWQRVGLAECSRVMVLGEVAPLAAKCVTDHKVAKAWQTIAGGPVVEAVPRDMREKCEALERFYNNNRMVRERWRLNTPEIFNAAPDFDSAHRLVEGARRPSSPPIVVPPSPTRHGGGGRKDHGVG